jgi:hypothetical protein
MKNLTLLWVNLMVLVSTLSAEDKLSAGGNPPPADRPVMLRAAIFVQNRAGKEYQDKIDVLNDLITARLTEKGFSIINKNDVVAKFRESRANEDEVGELTTKLADLVKTGKTEVSIEDSISGASALRLAQMINADYLVFATINSAGSEIKKFKGQTTIYATESEVRIYTLRIALKVMEGNQGGTVYGDVVTVSERIGGTKYLDTASSDIDNKLLDVGAVKIAENIVGKVDRIRDVKVKSVSVVEFMVRSNLEGATVELDGAVIGAVPNKFTAAPGLHQLRVSKEWCSTWERTVNVVGQGQILDVTLELSPEGARRYKDLETFKQQLKESDADIDIKKQQSEADAYAKKQIAEGEKKKREASYVHDDGIGTEIKKIIHGD